MKKYSKWYILSILFLLCLVTISLTFSKYTTTLSKSITVNARKPKYTVNFYPNRLPEEYQEVEYIESSGTQYIDTGYYASAKTRAIVEFSYTQSNGNTYSNGSVFGSANEDNGRPGVSICIDKDDSIFYRNSDMGESFKSPFVASINTKYRMETYKNDIKINNTIYTSSMGLITQTSRYSSYLFARHQKGYAYSILIGKIYFSQLYEDDILVRNFIPCYRKVDGIIGMYDTVNDVFYTNAGTGVFSKGNDVIATQQFTYGTAQNLTANTYTREGYKFTGWNTEPDGSGTSYADEEEVLNLSSTDGAVINLYAQWEVVKDTYIVNFYPNGLPKGYQEVEYIESTGTQWINTGIIPNENLKFEVETAFITTDSSSYVMGADKNYYTGFNIAIDWSLRTSEGIRGVFGGNTDNRAIMMVAPVNPVLENKYKIILEKNKITVNDVIINGNNWAGTQIEWPIALFGTNRNNSIAHLHGLRIYSFKVYENDEIIQSLIPCYYIENNKVGMYDEVKGIFLENEGTGTFIKGDNIGDDGNVSIEGTMPNQQFVYGTAQNLNANTFTREGYTFAGWNTKPDGTGTSYTDEQEFINLTSVDGGEINLYAQWEVNHYNVKFNSMTLPDEYQEVEYIESTGTQYIDTEFKPTIKTSVETLFSTKKSVSDTNLFGSRISGDKQDYTIWVNTSANKGIAVHFPITQQNQKDTKWVYTENIIDTPTKLYVDPEYIKVNDNVVYTFTDTRTDYTPNNSAYIFTKNENGSSVLPGKFRIYYFKIWDEDVLVRYYIPCYRNSDGEAGLYDLVNNIFYTNSGAGTFSKGNDVGDSSGTMSNQQFTYGIAQKLLANTYTKEGYTFTGWNTKPDGTGISYTDEQEVNNLTEDNNGTVTLYAQWN